MGQTISAEIGGLGTDKFRVIGKKVAGDDDATYFSARDGNFHDMIANILENTAQTTTCKLAAQDACKSGLVWKQRLPLIKGLPAPSGGWGSSG